MISRISLMPHKGQCTHTCVGGGNNTIQCNLWLTLACRRNGAEGGAIFERGANAKLGPNGHGGDGGGGGGGADSWQLDVYVQ